MAAPAFAPPSAPLSVADYRDLLLNLKAQNATDLSSPQPPSSTASPSPSFSSLPAASSAVDSASAATTSRLPVPSAVASKSFAEKKARLAAQAQQYKTLPTKRLNPVPVPSTTPPLQLPSSLPSASTQPSRASPPPTAAPPLRSLATGPLSPSRGRASGTFPLTSSSSAASSPTHAASTLSSDGGGGAGPKSRSGIFGAHLPPISTEAQRLNPAGHSTSASLGTLGSVLSPSTQQASAPVASASRARTSSVVSPRYPSDATSSQPASSPTNSVPPLPIGLAAGQAALPSPRRPAKVAGLPAGAFSPSLQARLASHHPLVSPRRRSTLDTSPTPRDGGAAVESLQAEFEKLSAEWAEQKSATGGGGGSGLNASFSHAASTRRAPAAAHAGSADDSALSFTQRRQRLQAGQAQNQTLPASPRRRPVERVYAAEGERSAAGYAATSQAVLSAAAPVGYAHAGPSQSVAATLGDGGGGEVEGVGREADVGLLDPFADGGEGLLDDEELNCSTTQS